MTRRLLIMAAAAAGYALIGWAVTGRTPLVDEAPGVLLDELLAP